MGKLCAKIPHFLFERFDASEERRSLKLFQGPTLGDVLGAVPVEGGEVNEYETLGATFGGNL